MNEITFDRNLNLIRKKVEILKEETEKTGNFLFADVIRMFIEPFEQSDKN